MSSSSIPSKKPINLLRGWPAPSLLPVSHLQAASQRLLSGDSQQVTPALCYGPDLGYGPLLESLAVWLVSFYHGPENGVVPDPARLCITGGASQSIACILQSFTDPVYTLRVWMAAPCYFLACPIFNDSGFARRLRAVREDEDGMDVRWLKEEMERVEREEQKKGGSGTPVYKDLGDHRKAYRHIIYCVPTCSNPSGVSMPLARREALVHLARKHDALVITDDVYDMLQWSVGAENAPTSTPSAEPVHVPQRCRLPRLSDLDRSLPGANHPFGNVVSNGSFSKLVAPGVRTGWVEGTPAFALGVSRTGSTRSGGAPSQLTAAVVRELLAAGDLDRWLATVTRPGLRRRHGLMVEAMRSEVAPYGASWLDSNLGVGPGEDAVYGGYFMWIKLPPGLRAADVVRMCKDDESLTVSSGKAFEVHGDEQSAQFDGAIRLSYAWEDEDDIVEGIRRLGAVLGRLLTTGRDRPADME